MNVRKSTEEIVIEIMFSDLNKEAQKIFLQALGMTDKSEGNFEIMPIAIYGVQIGEDYRAYLLYPNGKCPDCFALIPESDRLGDKCKNCGHVWTSEENVSKV